MKQRSRDERVSDIKLMNILSDVADICEERAQQVELTLHHDIYSQTESDCYSAADACRQLVFMLRKLCIEESGNVAERAEVHNTIPGTATLKERDADHPVPTEQESGAVVANQD